MTDTFFFDLPASSRIAVLSTGPPASCWARG